MEYYIAHHGVKGMKWGVRRANPFKKGFAGKQARFGSRLAYAKTNKKGIEKQKSVQIGVAGRYILKKAGTINKDGSVTTTRQQKQVRDFAEAKKKLTLASLGVGAGLAAVSLGTDYLMKRGLARG